MKMFKKNQIIIYVIVLMLMTAGYLNYTTNNEKQETVETVTQMEENADVELADIGDATLVNSDEVVSENVTMDQTTNTNETNSSNSESSTNTVVQTSSESTNNDYFVKSKLERDT